MTTPGGPGDVSAAFHGTSQRGAANNTPDTRPRHVFISYARADAPVAHQVEQILLSWGCQPWLDQRSLSGGQDWTEALEQAIDASQALVLILTSAALASSMVRREYERALDRGIPVLLIRAGSTSELPPKLVNVPLINFQDKRHAGSSLYFALADRGLLPPPPNDRLDSVDGSALFAVLEERIPPNWTVYQVPMSAYRWGLTQAIAPIMVAVCIAVWALYGLPRSALIGGGLLMFAAVVACMVLGRVLLGLRRWDLSVLLGRLQRETIIREPEACSALVAPPDRRQAVLPHRYLYCWAGDARVRVNRWGATRVEFIDRADGATATLYLPRRLPNRRAIAEQIVADVVTYHARQNELADARVDASAPWETESVPLTAHAAYCVIAPRSCGEVIASAQTWLATRGLMAAEMVWDVSGGGLLLPTVRGAAQSRFALFADVPAVTQAPRCRAILADLRNRGVLLIPLRVTATKPEPSEWSSTQWVDFSPSASRERSLLGLCDALDREGIIAPPTGGAFDPEVALARGVFERTPSGWSAFIGDPGMEWAVQRLHRRSAIIIALSIVGLQGLLGVSTIQAIQSAPTSSADAPSLMVSAVILILILAALSIPFWRLVLRRLRQARRSRDILHDRYVPQCLVVTPEGIVFHLVATARGAASLRASGASRLFALPTEYLAGGFAFRDLSAVTAGRTWSGLPRLRLKTRKGYVIDLPLASFLSGSDAALSAATEQFAASGARNPVTVG